MVPVVKESDLSEWHKVTLRVRYADTDRMGVVYHSNYFIYFEACRSDLIRNLWKPYSEIEKDGYLLLVIEANCRYRKGAEYDDILNVYGRITKFTETRIQFNYAVFRTCDEKPLVEGYTEHCFADSNGKPCRMPRDLNEVLKQNL
ncbi:acyl-CoA thioester hydrolase [candidate division LCP-89 bacterium B3_LCP]|uniref:Acyl-CoA thioester hydrolase n=1 Tax=candidate division LCP-89 bacterium B3_LCP TaxID=2012998 RepID=A0A532UU51_UNCL8|nr:MAG: acyl-CoA thioester hydrolase [candidate division LCP-89 bacterium B3_LCP]